MILLKYCESIDFRDILKFWKLYCFYLIKKYILLKILDGKKNFLVFV